jgi:hypothetical protein
VLNVVVVGMARVMSTSGMGAVMADGAARRSRHGIDCVDSEPMARLRLAGDPGPFRPAMVFGWSARIRLQLLLACRDCPSGATDTIASQSLG